VTFNPDVFVSSVTARGGMVKTNKFRFWFTLPTCFQGDPNLANYQSLVRDVEMWADSAQLPGTTQQTMKFRRYGYGPLDTSVVGAIFEDMPVRFISDAQGGFWTLMHEWMSKTLPKLGANSTMSTAEETSNNSFLDAYETAWQSAVQTTVFVSVYNDAGTEVQRATMGQAYPTAVSEVKLDWGDQGDVARFVVNFTFQDWYASIVRQSA
jgi:hypothetical protein